jgi:histidine triad (HIT) family protein
LDAVSSFPSTARKAQELISLGMLHQAAIVLKLCPGRAAGYQVLLYTGAVMSCLFCKIIEGTIPSTAEYQDDRCYAFPDIHPQAPVHLLIAPRVHLVSLAEAGEEHPALLGHLLWVAANLARKKGLAKGYRVVINTGDDGGQTVDHLHVHLLGGREMTWPPG